MADLVVTVPRQLWAGWIGEGDAAGDPGPGHLALGLDDEEWAFYIGQSRPPINPGERLYIVAWDKLRGYAPVTRVVHTSRGYAICRRGGAVAVTIDRPIKGFRGWIRRWWSRDKERPFPEWRTAGVGDG